MREPDAHPRTRPDLERLLRSYKATREGLHVKAHRKNKEEAPSSKTKSAKVAPAGDEVETGAEAKADAKADDGKGGGAKPAEPDGDLEIADEGGTKAVNGKGAKVAPRAEDKGSAMEVQDVPSDLDTPKGEDDEVKP